MNRSAARIIAPIGLVVTVGLGAGCAPGDDAGWTNAAAASPAAGVAGSQPAPGVIIVPGASAPTFDAAASDLRSGYGSAAAREVIVVPGASSSPGRPSTPPIVVNTPPGADKSSGSGSSGAAAGLSSPAPSGGGASSPTPPGTPGGSTSPAPGGGTVSPSAPGGSGSGGVKPNPAELDPNISIKPGKPSCPAGHIGTPPKCISIVKPVDPPLVLKDPDLVGPIVKLPPVVVPTCPAGQAGMPPNCISVHVPKLPSIPFGI